LAVLGMVGGFMRAYYAYRYQSELEEERQPWRRPDQ
jgi:hypothetical protein